MTVTIFVGDVDESLAEEAKKLDPGAFLIDDNNYRDFLSTIPADGNIVAYTSIGDLNEVSDDNCLEIINVLKSADRLIYIEPAVWSSDSTKQHTMCILQLMHVEGNTAENFIPISDNFRYLQLVDSRVTKDQQLWFAGCSITHGVGVTKQDRYGEIVANNLGLDASFLTKSGSSIEWAADQIIRSDIRKNDIVVFGLTSEYRKTLWHITQGAMSSMSPGRFDSNTAETREYHSLTSVFQVINFCRKIGANLLLMPIICSKEFVLMLSAEKELCWYEHNKRFLDTGDDGKHPGPKQHKAWAEYLTNEIKLRKVIK